MYKTTKKDFDFFVKRCCWLQEAFSIKNVNLNFVHKELPGEALAECQCSNYSRIATIRLGKVWDVPVTKRELSKTALHEMLHVALSRFSYNANARYATAAELYEAEEEVVTLFSNLLEDYF